MVEEVGLVDTPVLRLAGRFSDDTIERVWAKVRMRNKLGTYRSTMSISRSSGKNTFVCAHKDGRILPTSNNVVEGINFGIRDPPARGQSA